VAVADGGDDVAVTVEVLGDAELAQVLGVLRERPSDDRGTAGAAGGVVDLAVQRLGRVSGSLPVGGTLRCANQPSFAAYALTLI
jgi:hypothetical protein